MLIHIVRLISFNPIEWVAKSSSGFDTKTLCTKSSRETAQLTGSIRRAQSHLARCDPPFGTCACQWRPCSTVWLDSPSMAWVGPDAGVWWWTRQEMPWCGRRRRRMSYCGIVFIKQVSNELNKRTRTLRKGSNCVAGYTCPPSQTRPHGADARHRSNRLWQKFECN